jgi:hypothetical protein
MMEYIDNLSLEELEEQLAHNTNLTLDLIRKWYSQDVVDIFQQRCDKIKTLLSNYNDGQSDNPTIE